MSSSGKACRIGYWMTEKKIRKLNFDEFEDMCRNAGMEILKLDLDRPLDEQGPFDVILHKLTDQIARSEEGCQVAQKQIEGFQEYIARNPHTVVVDPIENVMQLFDRNQQYGHIKQLCQEDKNSNFFVPAFIELNSIDVEVNKRSIATSGLQYPLVCKPMVSHGSSQCHEMSIIFSESGLKDADVPCLVQTFVNHNAKLYKIFIVGQQHYIVERPSIKNLHAGDCPTVFFNSNDVSKPNASSFLTQRGHEGEEGISLVEDGRRRPEIILDPMWRVRDADLVFPLISPDLSKLRMLAEKVQERFGLDLLGIDVIIENRTGHYAIIDINTFPGFEDVPDFLTILLNLIRQKLGGQTVENDKKTVKSTLMCDHCDGVIMHH